MRPKKRELHELPHTEIVKSGTKKFESKHFGNRLFRMLLMSILNIQENKDDF